VILLPWELARFGKYLAASAVGVTNITALSDANYFDAGALDVPLLHYWSLAVEEQFYLAYPLALLIVGKWLPRARLPALLVVAGLSFAACIWGSHHRPIPNFYLAPTRAWELLLGAAVAVAPAYRLKRALIADALGVASLLVIALAIYSYGPYTPYPGTAAVAPCAATAALIITGRQEAAWVTRLAALRPLAFTGRISYSLYLWHWPVLVLFTYYNIEDPGAFELCVLIASIYLMAVASWVFVETPIRSRSVLRSNRTFVTAAAAVSAVALAAGFVLWKSHGLPWRFSPQIVALAAGTGAPDESVGRCEPITDAQVRVGQLCRYGPLADGPIALVWGDSHAKALLDVYQRLALAHHMRLYVAGEAACRPLLGVETRTLSATARYNCAHFNEAIARTIERIDPRLVVLNAHWIDSDADLAEQPDPAGSPGRSPFERAFGRTVRRIQSAGRSVCAVLDVPTMQHDVPYALAMARRRGIGNDSLRVTRAEAIGEYREVESRIRVFEQLGMLKVVDPKEVLCRTGSCAFQLDGKPLYRDRDHLSVTGADFVSSTLEPCFEGIR